VIEISIINILGTAILANFIAFWFQPIQGVKRIFFKTFPLLVLEEALDCVKCCGFWFGLLLFHDIFAAAICSLLGFIIQHIIDKINVWYEG